MEILSNFLEKTIMPIIGSIVSLVIKANFKGKEEFSCPKKYDSLTKYIWYLIGIIALPLENLVVCFIGSIIFGQICDVKISGECFENVTVALTVIVSWICTIVMSLLLFIGKKSFINFRKDNGDNKILKAIMLVLPILINSVSVSIFYFSNFTLVNVSGAITLILIIFEILGFVLLDDNKNVYTYVDLKYMSYRLVDIPVKNYVIGHKWISIKMDGKVEKIKKDEVSKIVFHNGNKK